MGTRRSCLLLLLASIGTTVLAHRAPAQEIELKHCDTLPVIDVAVGERTMLFLVDTAATSFLNLKSFGEGESRNVEVTSWSGTLATSAREITLKKVTIGSTKLTNLRLPAVDLSAIGKACGRKLDGILGVDLLAKLGATIDMKRQLVHVTTAGEDHADALTAEMQREMHRCLDAFNNSDEETFTECLDPKIVLFSVDAELYGREQAVGYFRNKYFHQNPPARLVICQSAFHAIGETIWYEYEFTIESVRGLLHGRGMAMCKKSEGRWRMASMHHSMIEMKQAAAAR